MPSSSKAAYHPLSTMPNESTTTLEDQPDLKHRDPLHASNLELRKPSSLSSQPSFDTTVTYGRSGIAGIFSNKYVVLCCGLASIGGLIFGCDQGLVAIILTLPIFKKRFHEIDSAVDGHAAFNKGLLTALIELGALLGAANQGWIADKYSRRYSMLIAIVWFVIGSIIQTAAIDYAMLAAGRFLGGIAIGMLSMVAPLYMSEIAPPEIRGILLVLEEWSIVFGIVLAYWVTYGTRLLGGGLSEWTYRLPFLLQIVPAIVLGCGIIFLPFSPRWLASKGRDEESLVALCKLRQLPSDDPRVRLEWTQIRAEVAFQQETQAERHPNLQGSGKLNALRRELAMWADCFRRGYWRRSMVGMGLMFFQQMVGINALIYYGPTLFESLGLSYEMQLSMAGVMNVCQLIGVTGSIFFIDNVGRRPMLMLGSAATCASQVVVAVLVALYHDKWPANEAKAWGGVAAIFFYMVAFGLTLGPIPWAMPSEIQSSSLRAKGVALATCSNWFWNFVIGLITPPLIDGTGYGAYVFFGAFCFLCGIWVYFFVPETAGRSLEEMDKVFGDSAGTQEEERRRTILAEMVRQDGQPSV
ncbi:putative MFS monosaccharide transporter [Protomyces lactucae-debilis]|uniref:Putative MFS monosaccharide transporter n=1 Tax=Protomyces lactucae-debilis TaxID=2754530 RepID=A0A1Y2ERX6_PROLT|nr:putative MFS monosaccharide transporter [Protomyces lactucae-debilis]ORY74340.1 putative MFS monosaccharide transporter [Protomyces lactucae-debilis]